MQHHDEAVQSRDRSQNPRAKFIIYGQEDPRPDTPQHKGKAIQQRATTEAPYGTFEAISEPNASAAPHKPRPGADDKVGAAKEFDPAVYARSRQENNIVQEQRKMQNYQGNGVMAHYDVGNEKSDKIGAGEFDPRVYAQQISTNALIQAESKSKNYTGNGVFSQQPGSDNPYPSNYHARRKPAEMTEKVGAAKTFDADVYRESRRAVMQNQEDSKLKNYVGAGGGAIFKHQNAV